MAEPQRSDFVRVEGAHLLIVAARYYPDIVDALIEGASEAIVEAGGTSRAIEVTGALEIPGAIAAVTQAADSFDGYVALGCVIRGETSHYETVCNESARALMDLTLSGLSIGNGILTVENEAQARARAEPDGGRNKGAEAARAALGMIDLRRRLANGAP
jgi:6,7-dimethyl-8-ribityllumazine synthase